MTILPSSIDTGSTPGDSLHREKYVISREIDHFYTDRKFLPRDCSRSKDIFWLVLGSGRGEYYDKEFGCTGCT